MFLNRQSTVVEATLQELLMRNNKDGANAQNSKVLALLFPHMNGMDEGITSLQALCRNNKNIRICPDKRILEFYHINDLARQIGNDNWISLGDIEKQKEHIDHIFIPVLPFSLVSNLASFNDTDPLIRMLLWALMSGKKVSALSAGADPYHAIWQESNLNEGTSFLKHEMKKQLQQIRGFGINLFNNTNEVLTYFKTVSQKESRQIITAHTISKLAETGEKDIKIEKEAVITPLARDIASKHNIRIIEE